MSNKKAKFYDDEWEVKAFFKNRQEIAKRPKNIKQTRPAAKVSIYQKDFEVMVKITSVSKNANGFKAALEYISREGSLDVENSNGFVFDAGGDLKAISNIFLMENNHDELAYYCPDKSKKFSYNMVFSMPQNSGASIEDIKAAANEAIRQVMPDHGFLICAHNDTQNPHIHALVLCRNSKLKMKHLSRADLSQLRQIFAAKLRDRGVSAKATSRAARARLKDKDKYANYHEVVDFGAANFDFKKDSESSFFIKLKSRNDVEHIIWGKELEELVKNRNITIGDWTKFAITSQKDVQVTVRKKQKNGSYIYFKRTTYKNIWDVSIKDKDERELTALKDANKKKAKYEKISAEEYEKTHLAKGDKEVQKEPGYAEKIEVDFKLKTNPDKKYKAANNDLEM